MENGDITDEQISASSTTNSNHAANQGRLHFQENSPIQGSWVARARDTNQWLQVDLRTNHISVTRVATQGRNGHNDQWVTKYKLQYSEDGVNFKYYREQGQATDKVK